MIHLNILNQVSFNVNTSKAIKAEILKDHERYNLDSVILENYETSDLYHWLAGQGINVELQAATDAAQNASFPELHRVAKEGRLHFPETLTRLADEMSTFVYTSKRPGHYSFGHATRTAHDDTVYSLNWSIFALRQQILDLYILVGISCDSKSDKRHLCFLMGGNLQLSCAEECYSFHRVYEMYRQFCRYQDLDAELTVPEFYKTYVKTRGIRLSQAV